MKSWARSAVYLSVGPIITQRKQRKKKKGDEKDGDEGEEKENVKPPRPKHLLVFHFPLNMDEILRWIASIYQK